jgi:ketosteroid isomerase-like protein
LSSLDLDAWIDLYVELWRAPGAERLGELFADDAVYLPGPFEQPIRGLAAIREFWDAERLGPDEVFEIDSEVVAVDGDTGVARLEVRYGPPREVTYRDLWIVTTDADGRCTRFEEWPHWPPGEGGTVAGSGVPE